MLLAIPQATELALTLLALTGGVLLSLNSSRMDAAPSRACPCPPGLPKPWLAPGGLPSCARPRAAHRPACGHAGHGGLLPRPHHVLLGAERHHGQGVRPPARRPD